MCEYLVSLLVRVALTPAPVLGQASVTVSLDTNALIAAHQGAAWKISRWMDNIAIHHARGCACYHMYINHLLGAQSLGQINLLHSDIGNAVRSSWPSLINDIESDADKWVQQQISNLHVQINDLKDLLHDTKRSLKASEATLNKECSHSKVLEQELKDNKSHLSEMTSHIMSLLATPVTQKQPMPPAKEAKLMWPPPQPEARPSCQGMMTSFSLQRCLGVLPTLTSSLFWKCSRVLPILSPS